MITLQENLNFLKELKESDEGEWGSWIYGHPGRIDGLENLVNYYDIRFKLIDRELTKKEENVDE